MFTAIFNFSMGPPASLYRISIKVFHPTPLESLKFLPNLIKSSSEGLFSLHMRLCVITMASACNDIKLVGMIISVLS